MYRWILIVGESLEILYGYDNQNGGRIRWIQRMLRNWEGGGEMERVSLQVKYKFWFKEKREKGRKGGGMGNVWQRIDVNRSIVKYGSSCNILFYVNHGSNL